MTPFTGLYFQQKTRLPDKCDLFQLRQTKRPFRQRGIFSSSSKQLGSLTHAANGQREKLPSLPSNNEVFLWVKSAATPLRPSRPKLFTADPSPSMLLPEEKRSSSSLLGSFATSGLSGCWKCGRWTCHLEK